MKYKKKNLLDIKLNHHVNLGQKIKLKLKLFKL